MCTVHTHTHSLWFLFFIAAPPSTLSHCVGVQSSLGATALWEGGLKVLLLLPYYTWLSYWFIFSIFLSTHRLHIAQSWLTILPVAWWQVSSVNWCQLKTHNQNKLLQVKGNLAQHTAHNGLSQCLAVITITIYNYSQVTNRIKSDQLYKAHKRWGNLVSRDTCDKQPKHKKVSPEGHLKRNPI